MREIKFRGQRLDKKEWVTGSLVLKNESAMIIHEHECGNYQQYGVIPETVGQYTGLNDKNGVEIYEGDILHEGDGTFWSRYEVVWFKNSCQFSLDCTRVSPNIQYPSWDRASGMTIIGNIHSNPELLK